MIAFLPNQMESKLKFFFQFIFYFLMLCANAKGLETIKIANNHIVNKPIIYRNVILDLSEGNFVIENKSILQIENSIINITIDPSNPFFITINNGSLVLNNNKLLIRVKNIYGSPSMPPSYTLIHVYDGTFTIKNNFFEADKSFALAFLSKDLQYLSSNNTIIGNTINYFHGGIYLGNSIFNLIKSNKFYRVSSGNIVLYNTEKNNISENVLKFPGNLHQGDGIILVNANHTVLFQNKIESSSGYGILIVSSKNIKIDHNFLNDNVGYGIYINRLNSFDHPIIRSFKFLKIALKETNNEDIVISNNYFGQNNFGLAGENINLLQVTKNVFIQKFSDNAIRKFWTNNDNLLKNVVDFCWNDNIYKEAFTQDVPGDNNLALRFIEFPAHGGVSL